MLHLTVIVSLKPPYTDIIVHSSAYFAEHHHFYANMHKLQLTLTLIQPASLFTVAAPFNSNLGRDCHS